MFAMEMIFYGMSAQTVMWGECKRVLTASLPTKP